MKLPFNIKIKIKKKVRRETLMLVVVAVLAIAAVMLGYLIYKDMFSQPSQPAQSQRQGSPVGQARVPENLPEVLATPGPEATDEEKQAHFELAQSLVQNAPYLDITGCPVMDPLVLGVSKGERVRVRNDDSSDHELVFGPEDRYPVPAKSTQDLDIDFSFGPGLYGYSCDQTPYATGLFLVAP